MKIIPLNQHPDNLDRLARLVLTDGKVSAHSARAGFVAVLSGSRAIDRRFKSAALALAAARFATGKETA